MEHAPEELLELARSVVAAWTAMVFGRLREIGRLVEWCDYG